METVNKKRKLFDSEDEEHEEEAEYKPSEKQEEEVEKKPEKSSGWRKEDKLFGGDDQEEEEYKPATEEKEDKKDSPKSLKEEPKIQPPKEEKKEKVVDIRKVDEDEEEAEYKPQQDDTINTDSTSETQKPVAQVVVQERKNLFDDEPIEIDKEADEGKEYVPTKSEEVIQPPKQDEVKQSSKMIIDQTLKQESERLKNQLIEDLSKLQIEDVNLEETLQEVEDPKVKLFAVTNPAKVSGHIRYTVSGVDSEGPFEETRRFSEFFALRNVLYQRWPGIYIPALPEKKLVGSKSEQFIEERRSLLERFMKELAKYDYLIHSKEFKIFARDKGDIGKILNTLLKQTPKQILEKYRLNFNVDEDQEQTELTKYKENIINFQQFLKKVLPVLEIQKQQLKKMSESRESMDVSYVSIINSFLRYEDSNIEYYSESDPTQRLLTHPAIGDFKDSIDTTFKGWRNPYKEAYFWLKGELLDLKGMNDALLGRDLVVKQQSSTESKRRSDQVELEKMTQGKTTIKSIFKSKSSKEGDILNLQAAIEVANKDIEDYKKVIKFLTIYHGEIAIEKFKMDKGKQYLRCIHNMCIKEISNSHSSAKLWHKLLEVENQS